MTLLLILAMTAACGRDGVGRGVAGAVLAPVLQAQSKATLTQGSIDGAPVNAPVRPEQVRSVAACPSCPKSRSKSV
ncbi:MAG TPA: hypothetical protein VMS98_08370 [Thermoanaerobaculia bacterium]|nr:hypothetical protein [Thermoanaerobaculia bacterium]